MRCACGERSHNSDCRHDLAMPGDRTVTPSYRPELRHAVILSSTAFLLHFIWESLQCRAFYVHGSYDATWRQMTVAALGDVVMTWVIYGAVAAASRAWRWPASGWRRRQWLTMAVAAVTVATVVKGARFSPGAGATCPSHLFPGTPISIVRCCRCLFCHRPSSPLPKLSSGRLSGCNRFRPGRERMRYHYVWLAWSSAFLLPWLALYLGNPGHRGVMLRTSFATALLGLTEPIYVPRYGTRRASSTLLNARDSTSRAWSSPLQSGASAALYNTLARRELAPVSAVERHGSRHRFHRLALLAPFVLFVPLYFLPWNPIYPSLLCLLIGALASVICRPDLRRKTLIGGLPPRVLRGFHARVAIALSRLHRGGLEPSRLERDPDRRDPSRGAGFRLGFRHVLDRRVRALHLEQERGAGPPDSRPGLGSSASVVI